MTNFTTLLQHISIIKQSDLPKESVLRAMAPPYREELIKQQNLAIQTAKRAAVLALLYPNKDAIVSLVLILRKTYKGVHSAQVGFPGGKLEKEDISLGYTALRETEEEVGVCSNTVELIKEMTSVYIPPSHYHVTPYLGITRETPNFVKEDAEVEDILEVPLHAILNEQNVCTKIVKKGEAKVEVPAFNLNHHLVWGATAMMLNQIKVLLKTSLQC